MAAWLLKTEPSAYAFDDLRREGTTAPRLHCTIGSDTVTTDLTGRPLPG